MGDQKRCPAIHERIQGFTYICLTGYVKAGERLIQHPNPGLLE